MVRVLHVTNAYPYEDVPEYGIFIKEQIDALSEAGVDNDVIFINGRKKGKTEYLRRVLEVRRRAKAVDIIHCHHLYSGLATILAGTRKPIVLSFLNDWLHEMDGVASVNIRRLLCTIGIFFASKVIFKSPVPGHLLGSKYINLPNGVDQNAFRITDRSEARRALGLCDDAFYVLFVSSKDLNRQQKRYDRYKETLSLLREMTGAANIKELTLVNQPRDRVLNYFNAADVHLLTSDFEGSPNSVKEALCCGLPVVSTDVGNVREMIAGIPHCSISTSSTAEDMALKLKNIRSSIICRKKIRDAFEKKDFTKNSSIKKVVDIYKSLLRIKK